jgi:hypothetical protein
MKQAECYDTMMNIYTTSDRTDRQLDALPKSCVDCYVLLDPNCYQCDQWTQQNDLIMTTHYDIYNYNALARPPNAFLFPV